MKVCGILHTDHLSNFAAGPLEESTSCSVYYGESNSYNGEGIDFQFDENRMPGHSESALPNPITVKPYALTYRSSHFARFRFN